MTAAHRHPLRSRVLVALVLLCVLALVGCSRLTQENFDRIESGMTYDEVVAILGSPSESKSAGVGGLSGTSATWEDKTTTISIQFLNEKVQLKSRRDKASGGG